MRSRVLTCRILGCAVLVALLGFATTASAHALSDAHLQLIKNGETFTGRLEIAVRDLDAAIGLDADGNGSITWGEVATAIPRITGYISARLALAGARAPCALAYGAGALADLTGGTYWSVPVTAACPGAPTALVVTYNLLFDVDAQHRGIVSVGGSTAILRDATPTTVVLGEGSSMLSFVREGIWHIWIGIDHVLFLVCLLLPAVFPLSKDGQGAALRESVHRPAESLRCVAVEVVEIVTAFTLAHSITLVISTVGLVQLPSRFVETAIALSVVAVAVNNLVRVFDARWAVAFALGLLHGFGFSSVLLDLGLPSGELIGSLLGFNLGVEVGQMAIVIVLLPILYVIRRTLAYQVLLWAGSGLVALIGLMWTYERWCS
ncbi:MAG: HupE/UreJ family protein [Deltaproteobacteria bacterium]|nr:HupE/UreJ family protein [Deltaproteobacteria bacterium]